MRRGGESRSLPPRAPPQTTPPRRPCAALAPLVNIQITRVLTAVIGCGRSNEATPPLTRRGRQRAFAGRWFGGGKGGRERWNAHEQLRRTPVTPARPLVAVTTPPPPLTVFIQSEILLAAWLNGAAIC